MAARGAESKEKVMQGILTAFPSAFKYDKEIRVPMMENGEEVQIKITLTAAKNNVQVGGDTALPGEMASSMAASPAPAQLKGDGVMSNVEPTEEEKQNVSKFLQMMGL